MQRFGSKAIVLAAGLAAFSAASALAANGDLAPGAPARVEMTADGPILVAPSGMTLYINTSDALKPGTSQCSSVAPPISPATTVGGSIQIRTESPATCGDHWPAYLADENAQPVGDFALIDRPQGEGGKQWAWRGQPLYMSIKDHKAGDRNAASYQAGAARRGRGGFRLAQMPVEFPPGLRLTRYYDDLMLATDNGKMAYTPKGDYEPTDELFTPIAAGALATVTGRFNEVGDWSIIDTAPGRYQYAFRGKPLYTAPKGLDVFEIEATGNWEPVAFYQGAGRPSAIETRFTLIGDVYADENGRTLYTFSCGGGGRRGGGVSCDIPGSPAGFWVALCGSAEECSRRWRPYLAEEGVEPVGEWSIVEVADPIFTDPRGLTYPDDAPRVEAWAYKGKPLYTYYDDVKSGDVWGHNVRWFFGGASIAAARPAGRTIGR